MSTLIYSSTLQSPQAKVPTKRIVSILTLLIIGLLMAVSSILLGRGGIAWAQSAIDFESSGGALEPGQKNHGAGMAGFNGDQSRKREVGQPGASHSSGDTSPFHAEPAVLKLRMPIEPRTLNPITAEGMAAGDIQIYVMETLLRRDANDQTWKASLADSWTEDPGGRSYTFHLREGAKWSDGVLVTAEDVKFSFDVLFDDRFQTALMRSYYDGIANVEIINPQTVVVHTKDSYYGNFISAAQITIVPKHIYEDPSRLEIVQNLLIGSGPYKLKKWSHGQSLTIEKNPLWWGYAKRKPLENARVLTPALALPSAAVLQQDQETYQRTHFKTPQIRFVFVSNNQTAIELMKSGDLDFSWLTADQYLSQGSTRFQSVKVQNAIPKSVKSIAFNLSRPIFQDLRVRQALSLLADRKGMIEHLFHGFMLPANGPWYRQSFYADGASSEYDYNPTRAFQMLHEAGWRIDPRTRILMKEVDGVLTPLRFTILLTKEEDLRYLTMFQESARQVGVDVRLQTLNLTSFNAALISRKFDAADVDHGAVLVEFDPRSTWNTGRLPPNGFNYSGYSDVASDQLIEKAMQERDLQKRIPTMQALYKQITSQSPEIFLFNDCDSFYAVSSRVIRPLPTEKYDLGLSSWSLKDSSLLAGANP